jgi:acetylornithine deacetylase/succinyl-diaminopimelate desuccinylase-like protein
VSVHSGHSESTAEAVRAWTADARDHVAAMIGKLVGIPTVAPGEPDAFAAIAEYARTAGFVAGLEPPHPHISQHAEYTAPFLPCLHPPRANLRTAMPQRRGVPTVLFSAHADVVPPLDHPEPWSGRFDGSFVHGRGSADTKNNIVMVVEAMRCMAELGVSRRANVALDVVSDEEAGGNGALSTILHGCAADEVVVLEPTGLDVFHGHRGCLSFAVVSEAPAGHMGSAAAHSNPIEDCLDVVARLRSLAADWLSRASLWPDFVGPPAAIQLNASGIRAEGWHGASPRRCRLDVSLGFLPDRTPEQARSEIEAVVATGIDGCRRLVSWQGIHNGAYLGSTDSPVARRLRQSARRYGEASGRPRAWHVSCDARLYAGLAGLDTVIFGSGDLERAHTSDEAVAVDQVILGIAILVDFMASSPLDDGGKFGDARSLGNEDYPCSPYKTTSSLRS